MAKADTDSSTRPPLTPEEIARLLAANYPAHGGLAGPSMAVPPGSRPASDIVPGERHFMVGDQMYEYPRGIFNPDVRLDPSQVEDRRGLAPLLPTDRDWSGPGIMGDYKGSDQEPPFYGPGQMTQGVQGAPPVDVGGWLKDLLAGAIANNTMVQAAKVGGEAFTRGQQIGQGAITAGAEGVLEGFGGGPGEFRNQIAQAAGPNAQPHELLGAAGDVVQARRGELPSADIPGLGRMDLLDLQAALTPLPAAKAAKAATALPGQVGVQAERIAQQAGRALPEQSFLKGESGFIPLGADQSGIASKLKAAQKGPLTKNPLQAAVDEAAAPTRFTVEPGKTVSFVRDTKTGERLSTIFGGPKHLENAGAEAARRNAIVATSETARTIAAAVASETSPLRKLSTAQLGALHEVTQNAADRRVIEALLGERAFSVAPEDKIAAAVNLVDRDVATQVRRAIRGVPDADLAKVEEAIDAAIATAKLGKTPANRAAVLQGLMDQQAKANLVRQKAKVNIDNAINSQVSDFGPELKSARTPKTAGSTSRATIGPPRGGYNPKGMGRQGQDLPREVEAVVGKSGLFREVYESIRSLKSLIDLPLGRQGIRVVGSPIAFAKGAIAAPVAYKGGPKVVTKWIDAKKADPLWDLYVKKGGLELTSPEAGSVVSKIPREESFPGGAIEHVRVLGGAIQHSNAAYTHSLNVMRWEKMKGDLKQGEFLWKHLFKQQGPLPDSEIAAIGRNVNVATGRGQLEKFSTMGVADTLGSAMFSPRNTISWPQFFTDWALHLKNGNKVAAALQAKTLVTWLGFSLGALKTYEAVSGQPTETDWRSSDFMKVVDGDQRTDIMGGGQQWMVALARMATGESKSLAGNIYPTTPDDVVGSFLMNRAHPALGTIEDASRLAITTAKRAIDGKTFTGLAKDAMGTEYGVLEVILGATAPIIAEGFVEAIRFEMEVDKKSIQDAIAEVAGAQLPGLLGFGGGRYRPGTKLPAMGGEFGDATPEKPVTPRQILLSGALQKKQNELVVKWKESALTSLVASTQYQALPEATQKTMYDKLSESVGKAASKAFGLDLAMNGNEDESKQGAVIAFNATPKSYDRGQLLALMQAAGRLPPETKAAIDFKRDQTDPGQKNYDMSADDYIHGAELVNAWRKAPEYIFGTPNEWTSAARAAGVLKKLIADTERRGGKASQDPQIIEFYNKSPGLATFYERDGSRRTKIVSPQRKAIEQDLLWDRFRSSAD